MPQNPQTIIKTLGMIPHPEGGWYVQTWRSSVGARPSGSAIYFLLESHQISRWHRIDAAEIWHWYAGSALDLRREENGNISHTILGPDLTSGQRPQCIIPPNTWQSATPLNDWVLVGCTVSPAFTFDTFELAPEGWEPG